MHSIADTGRHDLMRGRDRTDWFKSLGFFWWEIAIAYYALRPLAVFGIV
jgi:hypothetical protein